MYIYITEYGDITQRTREPDEEDTMSVDDGVLQIIRFDTSTGMFQDLQSTGKWVDVKTVS